MIDTIYVEARVADHWRTSEIIARFPQARVIECADHRAVFNRRQQNFRIQKTRPALILAHKTTPRIYPVPGDQHLGAPHNYYFSHLLNCPFDCRYCFLQGMFSSANFVLFVNYEDFMDEIVEVCAQHSGLVHVFSGYDCDSLALEPLTGFAAYFVEKFVPIDNAVLELRTKSTQIRSLLKIAAHDHCIVAMSLAPEVVVQQLEHGAPSLKDRLRALRRIQDHGWSIGLRFDPLIPLNGNAALLGEFFSTVFANLDPDAVHSVTLGTLRLPRNFAKRMFKLYPAEPLFAGPLIDVEGTVVFRDESADDILSVAHDALTDYVSADRIFLQHGAP